jgi:hypothetical protein
VWLGLGGAAVAAAAAAVLVGPGSRSPGPAPSAPAPVAGTIAATARAEAEPGATLARQGTTSALGPGASLQPGDALRTGAGGEIAVSLSTGTRLGLGGGGTLEVAALGPVQRFALRAGRLRATVAKLGDGQRFVVATADAEVEVRGTSFEVTVVAPSPSCGDGSTTRVRVFEGVVAVRSSGREARVRAGQVWPPRCSPEPVASGTTAVRPAPAAPRKLAAARSRRSPAPPRAPALGPASTLAEQNELYSRAIEARRRGDEGEALEQLGQLLTRYPTSPLVESARNERGKLLGARDERGETR